MRGASPMTTGMHGTVFPDRLLCVSVSTRQTARSNCSVSSRRGRPWRPTRNLQRLQRNVQRLQRNRLSFKRNAHRLRRVALLTSVAGRSWVREGRPYALRHSTTTQFRPWRQHSVRAQSPPTSASSCCLNHPWSVNRHTTCFESWAISKSAPWRTALKVCRSGMKPLARTRRIGRRRLVGSP